VCTNDPIHQCIANPVLDLDIIHDGPTRGFSKQGWLKGGHSRGYEELVLDVHEVLRQFDG
jgi:hypothetical protein